MENGINEFHWSFYGFLAKNAEVNREQSSEFQAFSLDRLRSIFLFHLIGMTLASVIFIMELIYYWMNEQS